MSDTGRQGLFCHHLYVAITVSFEIDTAVFTVVDIEGVVVFVPLVIAAIETDRVFVLVTTLDTEAALNLAIAVFHIVGNDTEGGVHIDINVQITVAGIHIDLIEVAGKILDGKRAVAQFVDGDALFQLVDLAISVLQFHIAVVQPVDMDVAVFGFSVHLPDISETEVGVLAVDIQLRAVADRGFAAIGQVQSGVVDIGDIHIAILHVDAERSREITAIEIAVFDIVFKSGEAAMKTLNGDLGKELDPILEGLGLHAMGWTESGYRHITTNNIEATSPEALKGLSIRTQENPIHMASFQAWGASPTPMAFSELFTALQQGAVDAEENPLAVITANRLYEVQNTVTLTGHFYTAGIFNINKDFYESLEGQDKEWFDEASEHFVQNLTQLIRDAQEGYIQLLKDNGINVVEVPSEQKDAFIESAASVYDLFIEKYGGTQELIDLAMKYNDDF